MGIKLSNNAFGTLAAGINSSATSITLTSGQGARFPTLSAGDYFYATLIDTSNNLEIVKCTARSTDVLTVVRGQESTTARAYSAGDRIEIRITAQTFLDATTIYDVATNSTGYFDLPTGTTAQRPGAASSGALRYNTDSSSVEVYDGTSWGALTRPFLTGVTGTIYAGVTSNLVVTGQNFSTTITVRFLEGGATVADVTGVTVTSGSATVAVPAGVFGQTAGDSIEVKILNSDGTISSNGIIEIVSALPTGGTITTASGYRYHQFDSSSNFVVPTGFTASAEYLVVAGGGGGGRQFGGGGGAGGYIASSATITAQTYSIVVGGGGAGRSSNGTGTTGSGSSGFGTSTTGGGGGGGGNNVAGSSGGSGGGGSGLVGGGAGASGGSGTAGQGNAGGTGISAAATDGGGGGGGKGAAGQNAANANPTGTGGVGAAWLNGTFYGGGGGGSTNASGGNGGGGAGVAGGGGGSNGTANTGGGGGATSSGTTSGAGGSGVVIVRYPIPT